MHHTFALVACGVFGHLGGRVDDVLRSGGRGVAIFKDQQDSIIAIKECALNTCEQTVVPKTAIAHDRQNTPLHEWGNARTTGQAHAISQNRMTYRKWLKRGQRMTTNVTRHMHWAYRFLCQLQSRKNGALGTANAHAGRPSWNRNSKHRLHFLPSLCIALQPFLRCLGHGIGFMPIEKMQQTFSHDLGCVFAARRQHVFAMQRRLQI